jgi:hypothetical protein
MAFRRDGRAKQQLHLGISVLVPPPPQPCDQRGHAILPAPYIKPEPDELGRHIDAKHIEHDRPAKVWRIRGRDRRGKQQRDQIGYREQPEPSCVLLGRQPNAPEQRPAQQKGRDHGAEIDAEIMHVLASLS